MENRLQCPRNLLEKNSCLWGAIKPGQRKSQTDSNLHYTFLKGFPFWMYSTLYLLLLAVIAQCRKRSGNLQFWTEYLRQTLVLLWNKALREKFNFYLLALTKIFILGGNWALVKNSMKFWDFLDVFKFPEILSLKLVGNSWGELLYTYLGQGIQEWTE